MAMGAACALPAWVSSAPFVSTSNTDLFVDGIDSTRGLGVFTYQATTIDYFKKLATESGIPYQNLINMFLRECAQSRKKPVMKWA